MLPLTKEQKQLINAEQQGINKESPSEIPAAPNKEQLTNPEIPKKPDSTHENISSSPQVKVETDTPRFRKKKKQKAIPQVRNQVTVQIEKIMEEGLADSFVKLNPVQQQEFKIKGEQTALEIQQILKSKKNKIKKMFTLLLSWLKIIPGVNKFFLEQQAKIKADKLLAFRDQQFPK